MKNFLFNNYNIRIDKIFYNGYEKYFFIGSEKIYIIETNKEKKEIMELYKLTNDMYNFGIKVNTFILNNNNSPLTQREKINICLLKENNFEEELLLNDIIKFWNINNNLKEKSLIEDWKNEVDIIEKEMIEYNKEYPIIQKSLDYHIGMAENAIELIYEIGNNINNDSIGHNITYQMFCECKLENPFTFIKVNRMYDMSNYIKYKFLKKEIDYEEIYYKIKDITYNEKIYLFSCLLYPGIYFDLVKNILLKKEKEDKLDVIICNINEYKELLRYFKNLFKSVNIINLINWI